jgi:hypothetical protein
MSGDHREQASGPSLPSQRYGVVNLYTCDVILMLLTSVQQYDRLYVCSHKIK